MKDLFKMIISGSKKTPPESVLKAFDKKYKDAVAVEWQKEGRFYESIFVYHGREIICRFNRKAEWVESRINQGLDEIAKEILINLKKFGEIMSSIRIEKPEGTIFEFVIRDKEMNRQIIFTNPDGDIIEKEGFNSVFDLF